MRWFRRKQRGPTETCPKCLHEVPAGLLAARVEYYEKNSFLPGLPRFDSDIADGRTGCATCGTLYRKPYTPPPNPRTWRPADKNRADSSIPSLERREG